MLQLMLEPGGVLRQRVQLTATMTRIAGDSRAREHGDALSAVHHPASEPHRFRHTVAPGDPQPL